VSRTGDKLNWAGGMVAHPYWLLMFYANAYGCFYSKGIRPHGFPVAGPFVSTNFTEVDVAHNFLRKEALANSWRALDGYLLLNNKPVSDLFADTNLLSLPRVVLNFSDVRPNSCPSEPRTTEDVSLNPDVTEPIIFLSPSRT
jgi:hypothetical protein